MEQIYDTIYLNFLCYKEIQLEIYFIEETRTTLPKVTKRYPMPYSNTPLIQKNRFNPFDCVPQTTLHFEISFHQKRMTLQNKQRDVRLSRFLLCKKICRLVTSYGISKAIFDNGTSRTLFCKFCQVILS